MGNTYLLSIAIFTTSPAAKSTPIFPQSLRKLAIAAVRIHTMKCSSCFRVPFIWPPPRVATSSLWLA